MTVFVRLKFYTYLQKINYKFFFVLPYFVIYSLQI